MAGSLRKLAWKKKKNATIGIGTLIVFIALVLTAAIASAVILKTAYSLKDAAESVGHATIQEVAGGIKVLDIVGSREASPGAGVPANTNIERIRFLVTVWAGSQGINMAKLRVHWMGPTMNAYLTLNVANYNIASATDFACDSEPVAVTNDWNPANGIFWLHWENIVYVELEVGTGFGNGGIGEMDPANNSGVPPNSHCAVYFEPVAGLVVEESFTTPTSYGTGLFIDLTMM